MTLLKVRKSDDEFATVISYFEPEVLEDLEGLPGEFVCGEIMGAADLEDENFDFRPEQVQENPVFLKFLHEFVATQASTNEELLDAAKEQKEGFVYMVDQRTPDPDDDVPPVDIIGAFEITDGKITPESYSPNPDHQMLTENGLVEIGEDLREAMVQYYKQTREPSRIVLPS
jgi:hypothetical protein